MVYIHGGAFVIGSGRWIGYEGTRLVQQQQIVLVTLNYRLGAFGFLELGEVGGADYSESGNYGLLDQIAALRWVKDNIECFGGDPDCITIFGQSAGSISISCLLACPRASGLLRRAICMSGPPSMVRSKDFAGRITQKLMRFAGVESVEKLSALPMQAILDAEKRLVHHPEFVGELTFGPTIDGQVLPQPPLHAIRAGCAKEVTLLIGTTLDEARLWSLYSPILRVLPLSAIGRWIQSLGLDLDTIREAYRLTRPHLKWGQLTMAVAGDALFWMPQIRFAEAQAMHRQDTRMYQIAWQSPVLGGRLGAPHAIDQPMIFGNLETGGTKLMIGGDPARKRDREAFSQTMQRACAAFARTGNPNHPGLPEWPAYSSTRRETMILDKSSAVQNDPLSAIRQVWNSLPFDGVHPAVDELPRVADILQFLAVRGLGAIGGMGLLLLAFRNHV